MQSGTETWREPPVGRKWVIGQALLVLLTVALVFMAWRWDASAPTRFVWPICLVIWTGILIGYVRPRTQVDVSPEGWIVHDRLRRATEVPWSDLKAVRGKADRLDEALVIERNDGSTVALPVGFPRAFADKWMTTWSRGGATH